MEIKYCKYLLPMNVSPEQEWMLEAAKKVVAEKMKEWLICQDEITTLVLCGYPREIAEKVLRAIPVDARTFIRIMGPYKCGDA